MLVTDLDTNPGSLIRRALAAIAGVLLVAVLLSPVALPPERAMAAPDIDGPDANFEAGLASFRSGDYAAALIHLRNALRAKPGNVAGRLLFGRTLLNLGHAAAAEKELKRARQAGADSALVLPPLGRAYLLLGKNQQVLDELLPGDRDPATEAEIHLLRGQAFLELHDQTGANDEYIMAQSLAPASAEPVVGLARIAFIKGRIDQAAFQVNKALAMDSRLAGAWMLKGDIERSNANYNEAIRAYSRTLALEPNRLHALAGRSAVLIDQQRYDEAEADIEAGLRIYADDPQINYLGGLLASRQGDTETALARYQAARNTLGKRTDRSLTDDAPTVLLSGLVNFALGQTESAYKYMSRYAQLRPFDGAGLRLLGRVQMQMGSFTDAIRSLARSLALVPDDRQTLLLLANAHLAAGDSERGVSYLQKAVEVFPKSARVRTDLGRGLLKLGRTGPAIEALRQALLLDSRYVRARQLLVTTLMSLRRYGEAEIEARRLVDQSPDSSRSLNILAGAEMAGGKYKAARQSLGRALGLSPQYIPALLNLGGLEQREGNIEAARAAFGTVLQIDSRNVPAMMAIATIALARRNVKGALDALEKARASDSDAPGPWYQLVKIAIDTGDRERALALANEFLRSHPGDVRMQGLVARMYMRAGQYRQAVKWYRDITDHAASRGPALRQLARAQQVAGDLSGAVGTYGRAVAWDEKDYASWESAIDLKMRLGREADARADIAQIRRIDSGGFVADRLLAKLLLNKGDFSKALGVVRRSWRRQRDSATAISYFRALSGTGRDKQARRLLENWIGKHPADINARAVLATALIRSGDLARSLAMHEALARDVPDNPLILNNLGWLYYRLDDPRALETARRAWRLDPRSAAAIDTYGLVLIRDGQAQEALRLLREAQARNGKDGRIQYHVALALEALGRPDDARAELTRALEGGPFDEADEARAMLARLGG